MARTSEDLLYSKGKARKLKAKRKKTSKTRTRKTNSSFKRTVKRSKKQGRFYPKRR